MRKIILLLIFLSVNVNAGLVKSKGTLLSIATCKGFVWNLEADRLRGDITTEFWLDRTKFCRGLIKLWDGKENRAAIRLANKIRKCAKQIEDDNNE